MKNFYYQIPTEIYFGKGQIKHLGEAIRKYGEKILFVYGGGRSSVPGFTKPSNPF
jgi:alcohol dehydrogenase YqhD (iron-dependent ADH family)